MVDGYYTIVIREIRSLGFRYLSNAKGSHEKWGNDAGRCWSSLATCSAATLQMPFLRMPRVCWSC